MNCWRSSKSPNKKDALPGELSRGMKQKLAIACGLLHSPKVIYFDEPLTGLDPLGIRRMKDSILKRARDGAAIIISSHLLHLVEEICSRILILKNGPEDRRWHARGSHAEIFRTARRRQSRGNFLPRHERNRHDRAGGSAAAAALKRTMIAALLYLQYHTFRNRLVSRFKRLKQPKYLIGAIVGGLYVLLLLFSLPFSRIRRAAGGEPGHFTGTSAAF